MKKFIKKFIIILLFILMLSSCFSGLVYANDEQDKCGTILANFCKNFYNNYNNQTKYDTTWGTPRAEAYLGRKYDGYYTFDCVGWVSFATHFSLGIGGETIDNPFMAMCPGDRWNGTYNSNCLEVVAGTTPPYKLGDAPSLSYDVVSSTVKPGDILFTTGINHVLIYVGDGLTIGSEGGSPTLNSCPLNSYSYSTILRINEKTAKEVIKSNSATEIFTGQEPILNTDSGGSSSESGKGNTSDNEFKYNGLGEGEFHATSYDLDWILNKLSELLDWFIGAFTYLTRMIFVGFTAAIESFVGIIMNVATGDKTEQSITVEKLINNQVPFLDVNFFNFSQAGGVDLNDDSVIFTIRKNIAVWYYIIRNVSIIGLLITLIYLGVRMVLSSIAEEKAKYKSMLVNWAVSFAIVFFIHYIMLFILDINSSLINVINTTGGEESLYDTVRNGVYAIQASIGWKSLLMYMILVYLLIRFLLVYIKRFIVVAVLTFMAPFIGVAYSIDKIKDNKSQSLGNWLKEYFFNVIIQSVHCLLYTIFMSLAFNVAGESIMGVLLACILINFILKAEVIFKKIFGIRSGNMTDTLKTTLGIMGATKVVKKVAKSNMKYLGKITSPVTKPVKNFYGKWKVHSRNNKINKLAESIEKARANGDKTITIGATGFLAGTWLEGKQEFNIDELDEKNAGNSYKLAQEMFAKKEKIDKNDKNEIKSRMSQTLHSVVGTAEIAAAIPMTIVDGAEGGAMAINAVAHLKQGINGYCKNNKDYTAPKGMKRKIKQLALNVATAGIYNKSKNVRRLNADYMKDRANQVNNAQYEIAKKKVDKQVKKEYKELLNSPNIDESELKNVVMQASNSIPIEIINNIVYRVGANMETDILQQVELLADQTSDITQLEENTDRFLKTSRRKMVIDKKKFNSNVETIIQKDVAKTQKINKADVSEQDIKNRFKSLSRKEKVEIFEKALMQSGKIAKMKKENDETSLEIYKKLASIADKTKGLDELDKNAQKEFTIISKGRFERKVRDAIKEKISSDKNISKMEVSEQDIEETFKKLTKQEKTEIFEKALKKSNDILDEKTKKLNEDKLTTKMEMENIDQIIDYIADETKSPINKENFRENFKELIRDQIAIEREKNPKKDENNSGDKTEITDADIDSYIYNLSYQELVKCIKTASTFNSSVVDDELRVKQEYKKILDLIELAKAYENKMKGKK